MQRTSESYLTQIRNKYNDLNEIWDGTDKWHRWSAAQIRQVVQNTRDEVVTDKQTDLVVLDVGSAGTDYLEIKSFRIDVDIAEGKLARCRHAVCANAEMLPLKDDISDLTICVGPVVNYCSLEEAVNELTRTTRPGGHLILHVELSNSAEYLATGSYNADAAFVNSFYQGVVEHYWVYSDSYARRILRLAGLTIKKSHYFHLLSALAYRLTGRPNLSSYFVVFDRLLEKTPLRHLLADSAIYVCQRVVHD